MVKTKHGTATRRVGGDYAKGQRRMAKESRHQTHRQRSPEHETDAPMKEAPRAAVAEVVAGDDPYLWLEAVDGDEALHWVERHNKPTLARLSGERFEQMRANVLDILDSDDRIPGVTRRAGVSLQLLA